MIYLISINFGFQSNLHKLFHCILVNGQSRDAGLKFLANIIANNEKRAQIHVEERRVAGDGVMINFLSVMQELAYKVIIF